MITETAFYAAVKVACDAAGIDDAGRSYVEMTCLENAFDASPADYFAAGVRTLNFFVSCGDLPAVSRNEQI